MATISQPFEVKLEPMIITTSGRFVCTRNTCLRQASLSGDLLADFEAQATATATEPAQDSIEANARLRRQIAA